MITLRDEIYGIWYPYLKIVNRANNKTMIKLPKRHRTHQLESESVLEFSRLLPSHWVYRTPSDDYGIDGEVELFSSDGTATGKKFLVQLKATDAKNEKKALKLRLKKKSANYFDALESPVLIVRYLAKTRKVFTRWFHSFEPYWESVCSDDIVMQFTENHLWHSNRVQELENGLNAYLSLTKGKNPFPLKLPIYITEDCVLKHDIAKFAKASRDTAKKYQGLICIEFSTVIDRLPPSYIMIDGEKLQVVLANRTGSCLHIPEGLNEEIRKNSVSDLFVSIGLALQWYGFSTQASRILYENLMYSSLKFEPEIVSMATVSLIQANKPEEYIELMELLFESENGFNAGQASMGTIIANSHFKNCDTELVISSLERISLSLQKRNIKKLASNIEYNLANFLRGRTDNYKKSFSHYKKAFRLNNDYRNKAYWIDEVASTLFLMNRYFWASKSYARSLEIKPSNHVRALYADSLFYSRRYAAAQDQLRIYFENEKGDKLECEWLLKQKCLHAIVCTLGIDEQKNQLATYDLKLLIKDEDIDGLVSFIKEVDALSGIAWFNVGIAYSQKGFFADATICFLIAAYTNFDPFDSWKNAIGCSIQSGDDELHTVIFMASFEKHGTDFLEYLLSKSVTGDSIKRQLAHVDLVQSLERIQEKNTSFKVRIGHGVDNSYDLTMEPPQPK